MWHDDGAITRLGKATSCFHDRVGHVESGTLGYGSYAAMAVCLAPVCILRARMWTSEVTGLAITATQMVWDPPGYRELAERWIFEARRRVDEEELAAASRPETQRTEDA